MKYIKTLIILLIAAALFISCKPAAKELTPELFLQIENEVLSSDLTPEAKEAIAEKNGITLQQYTDYEKQIETSEELKAKVGEARLKMQQGKTEGK